MRKTTTALGAAALVTVLGAPVQAGHGGIHPTYKIQTVYFHCTGTTKVDNVNAQYIKPVKDPEYTSWNTTPPAQSVQQGAGCGSLEPAGAEGGAAGQTDSYFTGKFKGNLRSLTFRIHNLALSQVRAGTTVKLTPTITINGKSYLQAPTVVVTPQKSATGASELVEFSVTGIDLGVENGDGSIERTFEIMLDTDFVAADQSGAPLNAWVWDTIEVPSGITFNPTGLAAAKVAAKPS